VPASATARAVTLSVSTTGTAQDPSGVRVYRVFEDWSEAEATWELRAAGQPWSTAGSQSDTAGCCSRLPPNAAYTSWGSSDRP
jgi:hypothetical protein